MVVLQHAASSRRMQLHVIHMLTVIIKSDVHYSIAPSIVAMFLALFNVNSRLWGMPILPEIAIGQKRMKHLVATELNAKYRKIKKCNER